MSQNNDIEKINKEFEKSSGNGSREFIKEFQKIINEFIEYENKGNGYSAPKLDLTNELEKLMECSKNLDIKYVPYDQISIIAYNCLKDIKNINEKAKTNDEEHSENLSNVQSYGRFIVEKLKDYINKHPDSKYISQNSVIFIIKSMKHYTLACMQFSSLYSNQEKEISNLENKLHSYEEEYNTAKTNIDNLNKQRRNIYSDFIAILGIFTAITFATFGGLNLITTLFKNIKDINYTNLGNSIILGATYLFCLYIILVCLFIGLSKFISGKRKYVADKRVVSRILLGIFILFFVGVAFSSEMWKKTFSPFALFHPLFYSAVIIIFVLLITFSIDWGKFKLFFKKFFK